MTPNLFITARRFAREIHNDIAIKTISSDIRPQFEVGFFGKISTVFVVFIFQNLV